MRLRELFFEANETVKKKLGRAFNHLEDLVFFYGVEGTIEALEHVKEIATQEGSESVRMKWDGNPQIYWGREVANGPLILSGHNGWARGAKTDSPEAVKDFIANKSGTPKTDEERKQRDEFAAKFANLYPAFDAATPKDFVGFVYADALFLDKPNLKDNVYTFCPNPKSQTCYHVRGDSELGKRIAYADVMVVGHAFFPEFGMDDSEQEPLDDFDKFNANPKLIVQGPIYTETAPEVDQSVLEEVNQAIEYAEQYGSTIDNFLGSLPDPDKNGIFYPFFNQMSREHAKGQRNFADLSGHDFMEWMKKKGVSAAKQRHIVDMVQEHPGGLDAIFFLIKEIRDIKDAIDASIKSQPRREIWDTNGEGHVRYPQKHHKFGAVKYVPTTWVPAGN